MTTSTAQIKTPHASKYLQQLCKHFSHKVTVEFTPEAGKVSLPFGECRLSAKTGELSLTATTNDADPDRIERFIGDHLARFAFRENPEISWQRST